MASLMETLTQQLGGDALKQISGLLGSDEKTTGNTMAAAVPMLLGALSRNSSNEKGAASLLSALNKDHDGSIMDNLSGFLRNSDQGPGDGILGHVLGNKRQAVEKGLSTSTGMDSASVAKLLTMLAPVVMGAIGKNVKQGGMNAGALTDLLSNEKNDIERKAPKEMGMLNVLLDADGDGDVDLGDVAKKGVGMLGKLFGGGR